MNYAQIDLFYCHVLSPKGLGYNDFIFSKIAAVFGFVLQNLQRWIEIAVQQQTCSRLLHTLLYDSEIEIFFR
jgi:hypothetical protein